jgi:hypothetical protein
MAGTDWGTVLGGIAQAGITAAGQIIAAKRGGGVQQAPPGWGIPYDPRVVYSGGYGYPPPQAPQPMPTYYGGPYQAAEYIDLPAGPTQAGIGGALVPLAAGAVRVATPALRSAVAFLSRWIAPAAAVEVASELIASGGWPSKAIYARAGDNKVVGIMRGDIKAIKRVKRQGRVLQKALRQAGVGRRSLPRARRRRRAA